MKASGDPWIKFAEAILQRPFSPEWHEDFLRWEAEAEKSYLYDLIPQGEQRKAKLVDKLVLLCVRHGIGPKDAAALLGKKFEDEPHAGSGECLHCMAQSRIKKLMELHERLGRWPEETSGKVERKAYNPAIIKETFFHGNAGRAPGLPSRRLLD